MTFVRSIMFVGLAMLWNLFSMLEGVLSQPLCCSQCYQSQAPTYGYPFPSNPITYTYTIFSSDNYGNPSSTFLQPTYETPATNNYDNTQSPSPIVIEFPLNRGEPTVFNIKLNSDKSSKDEEEKDKKGSKSDDDQSDSSNEPTKITVAETYASSNSEAASESGLLGDKQESEADSEAFTKTVTIEQ